MIRISLTLLQVDFSKTFDIALNRLEYHSVQTAPLALSSLSFQFFIGFYWLKIFFRIIPKISQIYIQLSGMNYGKTKLI